jgi:hypothetical protein
MKEEARALTLQLLPLVFPARCAVFSAAPPLFLRSCDRVFF